MSLPVFGDFGKSVTDLLTKKFDYFHSFAAKNTEENVTLETGVKCQKENDGYAKFTYKDGRFGQVDGEVHTAAADSKTNGSIKFNKLSEGLEVTVSGTAIPDGKLKAKYAQKNFNVEASVNSDLDTHTLTGAAVAGHSGVAVGGTSSVEISKQGTNFAGVDAGVQYTHDNKITAAIFSSKNLKVVTGSVFYAINANHSCGVSVNTEGGKQSFALGGSHNIDNSTTLKTSINSSKQLGTSLEHKLANPKVAVNLASQFDLGSGSLKASKWGMGVTFGNY